MNDYLYSSKELLEMALKIEEDGQKFYTYLANNAKDKGSKEFFSYLANQEEEHVRNFKELSKDLVKEVDEESWEEASKYIRSVVENKIFPSAQEMIEKAKEMSMDDILKFAISIEKETVIFYEELYDLVKDEESKKILSRIIRQEVSHVRNLSSLRG